MVRTTCLKMLVCIVTITLSSGCFNNNKYKVTSADLGRIKVDSLPDISNVSEIRFYKDDIYITYETREGWGQQFVSRYSIDEEKVAINFEKEYFKKDNGYYQVFVPLLFTDAEGALYVSGRDEPAVYHVNSDGSAQANGDNVITNGASAPYEMVMEARQVFHNAPNEYLFIGRQPKDGIQGLYLSHNDAGSVDITEVTRIVYDRAYPSWTVNFGRMTFDSGRGIGAFAFQMFPAVQFIDVTDGTNFNLVLPDTESGELITEGADLWEQNAVQFKDITSNSFHIYALYWGMSFAEAESLTKSGKGESRIIRFDWEGNITDIYVLDRCISSIGVSEDDSSIICQDGKDFYCMTVE